MTRPGRGGNDNRRLLCEACGFEFDDKTTVAVIQMHTQIEHPEYDGTPRLLIVDPGQTFEEAKAEADAHANQDPPRWQRRLQKKKGRR